MRRNKERTIIMQATYSPISFNGRLAESLEKKKSLLEERKQFLQAQEGSQKTYEAELGNLGKEAGDLFKLASEIRQKGAEEAGEIGIKASDTFSSAREVADQAYSQGYTNAANTLASARKETEELVKQLQDVASDSKQLAEQAKQDLKEISTTKKPLRQALAKLGIRETQEGKDVSEAVKTATKILNETGKKVTAALEEVEKLEKEQQKLETNYSQTATNNRIKAKTTSKEKGAKTDADFKANLAKIKEERAQALDKAKEAYRKAMDSAKTVLDNYEDQAGHDNNKANDLRSKISSIEKQVFMIKVQAYLTRATNLPNLAAATVGLGAAGEGATNTVTNFVLGILQRSKLFKTVDAELAAINAADTFLTKGSNTQKTIMATGIEMNSDKIVANAPEDLKVIEGLQKLDTLVDEIKQTS